MLKSSRFYLAALACMAACSGSPEKPVLSDDLTQDLARAGGSDVQLAGGPANRVDVISAAERGKVASPVQSAAPRISSPARAPRIAVPSVAREIPAEAAVLEDASSVTPVVVDRTEPEPRAAPMGSERPRAPSPQPQREPRGGWKTPGQIIRNAPFPINP